MAACPPNLNYYYRPGAVPAGVDVPAPTLPVVDVFSGNGLTITVEGAVVVVVVVAGTVVTVGAGRTALGASVPLLFMPAPPTPVPTSLRVEPSPIPLPVLRVTPLVSAPAAVVSRDGTAGETTTAPGAVSTALVVVVVVADSATPVTASVLLTSSDFVVRFLDFFVSLSFAPTSIGAAKATATVARMGMSRFIYKHIGPPRFTAPGVRVPPPAHDSPVLLSGQFPLAGLYFREVRADPGASKAAAFFASRCCFTTAPTTRATINPAISNISSRVNLIIAAAP